MIYASRRCEQRERRITRSGALQRAMFALRTIRARDAKTPHRRKLMISCAATMVIFHTTRSNPDDARVRVNAPWLPCAHERALFRPPPCDGAGNAQRDEKTIYCHFSLARCFCR